MISSNDRKYLRWRRNIEICPKCKGNVADGLNVCTHCGAVITPQAAKPKKKDSTEVKRDNQAIAITSVIITLVGIFIMFEVSALVGMIIYLIAFALSFNELRKDPEFRPETIVPFAKKCLSKENFKGMGLMFLGSNSSVDGGYWKLSLDCYGYIQGS